MAGYNVFAQYYDALTRNVNYRSRAEYLSALLMHLHHDAGITLDLACGTGSLTLELYKMGFDIYGVDSSMDMLSKAKDKAYDADADIMFLCQKMQKLDLYGTVDTVFCSLDSINHIPSAQEVLAAFRRVAFFLNADGYFIFDVNTPYKHEKILANHTFVYDLEDVYCVWQNRLNPRDKSVRIDLDFFERRDQNYVRSHEHFTEYMYTPEKLCEMLREAGFDEIQIFGDMSFDRPEENAQRLIVAAHIINSQNSVYEAE